MANITLEDCNDYVIVKLQGDFVGSEETDKLRETFRSLAEQQKSRIIIDLKEVVYLASVSLGVLLSGNAMIYKIKGKVVLCNPSDYLKNIFSITKLTLIFKIFDNLNDAIEEVLK